MACERPRVGADGLARMSQPMEPDKVYQRIGEFVVLFQWVENTFREIGWFILDPQRKDWPPQQLRTETTHDLIEKVDALFASVIGTIGLPDAIDRREHFRSLVDRFHDARKYRNRCLHSAYIELKAGGEVQAFMRSNPKLSLDPESQEPVFDQEILSEKSFAAEMIELAEIGFAAGTHYKQLLARL